MARGGRAGTIKGMKRTAIAIGAALLTMGAGAAPAGQAAWERPTPKRYAQLAAYGLWEAKEWPCLDELWDRESHWNPKADNPRSTAFGIPQILGLDPDSTPEQQIIAGIRYIRHRYDTPCQALRHHDRRGWY